MWRRMDAEILFTDANDVNLGIATLIECGFDVEILLDWIDPYSSATWINARTISELDELAFFRWVAAIVEPLHGDVVEAGLAGPPPCAA